MEDFLGSWVGGYTIGVLMMFIVAVIVDTVRK